MTVEIPVVSMCGEGASCEFELDISSSLAILEGHFPGLPLLPGVVMIDWAARLAARSFGTETAAFSRLLNVKFQKPVRPGTALTLTLKWSAGKSTVAFSFASAAGCHAQGVLEYAATEACA